MFPLTGRRLGPHFRHLGSEGCAERCGLKALRYKIHLFTIHIYQFMKRSTFFFSLIAGVTTLTARADNKPAAAEAAKPAATPAPAAAAPAAAKTVTIEIKTSMGLITAELNQEKAPITVANFVKYIEKKHFDNTVFHRVIPGFMNQAGGFEKTEGGLVEKKTDAPIRNEAGNGLSNVPGTLSMARTSNPDSATGQFFINVGDNSRSLDQSPRSAGYAVFGKVVTGMDIVTKINNVPTASKALTSRQGDQTITGAHQDVPVTDVVIESVRIVPAK
jgi:cyclophilin family peptidyl-prolyl cis-trans isomerase